MKKLFLFTVILLGTVIIPLTAVARSARYRPATVLTTTTQSQADDPCSTAVPNPTMTPPPTNTPVATHTPDPYPASTTIPSPTPCIIPPTMTPSAPVFTATVHIQLSQNPIVVSEAMSVMVDVTVSEGCELLAYDLTLSQVGINGVLFNPTEVVIGPPLTLPVEIPVTAVTDGTTQFHASIYGERYCNDYYNWVTVGGLSEEIEVHPTLGLPSYEIYLPIID